MSGQSQGFIITLLVTAIDIYSFIIFIRVIMSWFVQNPRNSLYRYLVEITEPLLGRIRRLMPRSRIDFSPMIAIILLEIISNFIKTM